MGVQARNQPIMPTVEGPWRRIATNPDLGDMTGVTQQPVDFHIWKTADGAWQLWSCIRHTRCGGHTRVFYRWESGDLHESHWRPMGIAMRAAPSLGEEPGGLQSPYVVHDDGRYHMFYGDWNRICLAQSEDGKTFHRVPGRDGQPGLFSGPLTHTRDPCVVGIGGLWHCYYAVHDQAETYGAAFCRTSADLRTFSQPVKVAAGGQAGGGPCSAECPHVILREELGLYILLQTQCYVREAQTTVYASPNPQDFGINDDRYRLGTLPVAAPEVIAAGDELYLAALTPDLDGIRMAKLAWACP